MESAFHFTPGAYYEYQDRMAASFNPMIQRLAHPLLRTKFRREKGRSNAAVYLAALFLGGCASLKKESEPKVVLIPGASSAPSQVTPSEALATAVTYTKHSWRPFGRNILHGADARGIRVDTPDTGYQPPDGRAGWWIPGEANQGIPYKWGGFDDPAAFDRGIASGLAGGDVSSPAKRRADNAAVSASAVGVDCSGFVSRCLKLPTVHDTVQLPAVCHPLSSADELQPGDLLNIPHRHVLLFAGWAQPDHSWILFYETGGEPDWKPALKQAPLNSLLALGYEPIRYNGMAHPGGPSGKEVLSRALRSRALVIPNPTIGEP
ncbi:MAG: hypothetical protein JWL59_587 [Chthoniobacteraceae bacterium]|nr:hypothetical protein [Chthoniobacteraceae bacterium]